MKEKKQRGKPKRYKNEESERISVLVRPRYKNALELIKRDRNTTLSEVMELAIISLAENYSIDGKKVIDWVRPQYEDIHLIYNCVYPRALKNHRLPNFDPFTKSVAKDLYETLISDFDKPASVIKSNEKYFLNVLWKPFKYEIIEYFDVFIFNVVNEFWKIGKKEEEAIKDIQSIINYIKTLDHKQEIPKFEDAINSILSMKNQQNKQP